MGYVMVTDKKIAWRLVLIIRSRASPNASVEINSIPHAMPIYCSRLLGE